MIKMKLVCIKRGVFFISKNNIEELKNMTGKMYGSWKVIKYLGKDKHSHHILLCECQCDKKNYE